MILKVIRENSLAVLASSIFVIENKRVLDGAHDRDVGMEKGFQLRKKDGLTIDDDGAGNDFFPLLWSYFQEVFEMAKGNVWYMLVTYVWIILWSDQIWITFGLCSLSLWCGKCIRCWKIRFPDASFLQFLLGYLYGWLLRNPSFPVRFCLSRAALFVSIVPFSALLAVFCCEKIEDRLCRA